VDGCGESIEVAVAEAASLDQPDLGVDAFEAGVDKPSSTAATMASACFSTRRTRLASAGIRLRFAAVHQRFRALPLSAHDLTAARTHGIIDDLTSN
jgi:hypothetical protein